jgi:hypothetical protein
VLYLVLKCVCCYVVLDAWATGYTILLKLSNIVNLNCAFAGMTMDIISLYSFSESMNSMECPKYGKQMLDILHQGLQIRPLPRQFPSFFN